ncbi:hypothetical protein RCL1_005763 [Eukaryota sp. TZLM3-RCL]
MLSAEENYIEELDNSLFNDRLQAKLHDFQKYGILKIFAAYLGGLPGFLLSDEMGLGKTAQSIVATALMMNKNPNQSVLIAVRNEEHMNNWEKECLRWFSYAGQEPTIKKLVSAKGTNSRIAMLSSTVQYGGICLISHGLVRTLISHLSSLEFDILIIDEAHHILNPSSKTRQAFELLQVSKFRLLLSATPAPSDPLQFYRLISFINPDLFGNEIDFKENFQKPIKKGHNKSATPTEIEIMKDTTNKMLELIDDLFIQRGKEFLELPSKSEYVAWVDLCEQQKSVLELYFERVKRPRMADFRLFTSLPPFLLQLYDTENNEDLTKQYGINGLLNIEGERFNPEEWCKEVDEESEDSEDEEISQALEGLTVENETEICTEIDENLDQNLEDNDQNLEDNEENSDESEEEITDDEEPSNIVTKRPSRDQLFNQIITQSPKLKLLILLLSDLYFKKHSTLVFVHRLFTLDVVYFLCKTANLDVYCYEGSLNKNERKRVLKHFTKPKTAKDSPKILILTTQSGSEGLNLIGADRVVIAELGLSPSDDIQAIGRAHRIGQPNPVVSYRLVTSAEASHYGRVVKRTLNTALDDKNTNIVDEDDVKKIVYAHNWLTFQDEIHRYSSRMPTELSSDCNVVELKEFGAVAVHRHDLLLQILSRQVKNERIFIPEGCETPLNRINSAAKTPAITPKTVSLNNSTVKLSARLADFALDSRRNPDSESEEEEEEDFEDLDDFVVDDDYVEYFNKDEPTFTTTPSKSKLKKMIDLDLSDDDIEHEEDQSNEPIKNDGKVIIDSDDDVITPHISQRKVSFLIEEEDDEPTTTKYKTTPHVGKFKTNFLIESSDEEELEVQNDDVIIDECINNEHDNINLTSSECLSSSTDDEDTSCETKFQFL